MKKRTRDNNNHYSTEEKKAKLLVYYQEHKDEICAKRRIYYNIDRKNQLREALSMVLPEAQLTDAFLETVMPMFKRTGVSGFAKRFAELQTMMTISVQKPTNLPTSIST